MVLPAWSSASGFDGEVSPGVHFGLGEKGSLTKYAPEV